jgi:hypothetical protein
MAAAAQAQTPSERPSGPDPLGHWLAQEAAGGIDGPAAGPAVAEERILAGGWWLLPVLVMALPIWGVILWIVLR